MIFLVIESNAARRAFLKSAKLQMMKKRHPDLGLPKKPVVSRTKGMSGDDRKTYRSSMSRPNSVAGNYRIWSMNSLSDAGSARSKGQASKARKELNNSKSFRKKAAKSSLGSLGRTSQLP